MKKIIGSSLLAVSVFALAIVYYSPLSAHAQVTTAVNCPAGYTCTPTVPQTFGCPVGYTCVPTVTNQTSGQVYNGSSAFVWTSSDVASSGSVEGQLRASGQTWAKVSGTPVVGSYVQDILEGRMDQPQGRGAIGKVTSLGNNGVDYAMVDFGNGYSVGINLSELSLVSVTSNADQYSLQSGWHSSDYAAPDSVEGQLRASGQTWTKTNSTITIGSYVQDILEGGWISHKAVAQLER